MGDMKNPGRGVPLPQGAEGNDPFAELADMFEAELASDPVTRPSGHHAAAGQGFVPAPRTRLDSAGYSAPLAPLDQDFETAFAEALGDDFDFAPEPVADRQASTRPSSPPRAEAADAYQSWIVPRGTRPAAVVAPVRAQAVAAAAGAATTVSHTRSGYGHRSLGPDLETAIHGLSAPANPRDVIVVETQSFAPERVVDDYEHEQAAPELDEFDELIASELAVMNEPRHAGVHAYPAYAQGAQSAPQQSYEAGDPSGAFDEYEDDYAAEQPAEPARSSFRRNMVSLGGGVAVLALIGAVGLFVWNGGGTGSSLQASNEPLLIKADTEPFKTVPKDPGGRTVPNQNKAVYNRVNGAENQPSTTQQALLTDAEEPMDLPAEEEPSAYQDLPGVDMVATADMPDPSQARIEPVSTGASEESAVPLIQARKVRTMVVRPDGTLVPASAEPEAPVATAAATPAPAPAAVAVAAAPIAPTPEPAVAEVPAPAPLVAEAPAPQQAVEAPAPASDPIEVAAIPPQPAAMPTSGYFVQISSQPSEAAAQQSMRSLGTKFSSVIGGRPLGIQSAEIPGKGTFYRVRVAAASKDEASDICTKLKSAGGNCFVAR